VTIHPKFEVRGGEAQAMNLAQAILLYRRNGGGAFATVHAIGAKGAMPVILEGKPMTAAAAVRLGRELSRRAVRGGFVPPNLLYMDGETIAWWVPPARRHIAFRAPELGAPERGETVPHSGLVFAVDGRRAWRVWAVTGAQRPDEKTPLCRAPYFNVWDDGTICTGNVTVPDGTTAERIETWDRAFFGSFFTHPNGSGPLVTYRGGAFRFWRHMLDGKHAEFPERVLVPSKMTLAEALTGSKR
jgi:PRTRC genetic system protein B